MKRGQVVLATGRIAPRRDHEFDLHCEDCSCAPCRCEMRAAREAHRRTQLAILAARAVLVDALRTVDAAAQNDNAESAANALEAVEQQVRPHILTLIRVHYATAPIEAITESLKAAS